MLPERRHWLKQGCPKQRRKTQIPSRGRERGQGSGRADTEPELLCPQRFVLRIQLAKMRKFIAVQLLRNRILLLLFALAEIARSRRCRKSPNRLLWLVSTMPPSVPLLLFLLRRPWNTSCGIWGHGVAASCVSVLTIFRFEAYIQLVANCSW